MKHEPMPADGGSEERFVKTFVRKSRRDRLLYELSVPAKRNRALDRFCHGAADLIDPDRILFQGADLERTEAFLAFVSARKAELCPILSPDGGIDGLTLPLPDAVALAVFSSDAAIVLGSDFAVVLGESVRGGRSKFLLTER